MAHLTGDLIRLRAPEPSDADLLNPAFSDPEVLATLEWRFPQPIEGFHGFVESVRTNPGHILFVIERRSDGTAIGSCDLTGATLYRAPSFGIWVGKEFWDQGFGSDALRTACRYAFDDLGQHRVSLTVLASNDRAIRAYEKVGFVREGVMREEVFADGRWTDVIQMGLLADDLR